MKTYRVRISKRARRQLRQYIWYLINEKNNPQAASAVSDDYEETVKKLDDTTATAIEDIVLKQNPTTTTTGVYNLMGVKIGSDINSLPNGIYIINGKKYLKK